MLSNKGLFPERYNPERAKDVDCEREQQDGESPSMLHLLLPTSSCHRPIAKCVLPHVQEQVSQRVSGERTKA